MASLLQRGVAPGAGRVASPRLVAPCAPGRVVARSPPATRRSVAPLRSIGSDAVGGWLDVAKLVSATGGSKKTPYDGLASDIGRDVYVDVGGWHLYMRDLNGANGLKMSQVLAGHFGPKAKSGVKKADVEDLLRRIPLKLGQGKTQVSLFEAMPSPCVSDLARLIEDHADD